SRRRQIHHLESLVFRQVILPGKKFGRLQDRSGRAFPRVSENHENQCGRNRVERLATGSSRRGNQALFGKIRDPARRTQESPRGKRPPHRGSCPTAPSCAKTATGSPKTGRMSASGC